jgi:hypothetical protein
MTPSRPSVTPSPTAVRDRALQQVSISVDVDPQ